MSQPMTHARIGYENIIRPETILEISTAEGYSAQALFNDFPNEKWSPGGGFPQLLVEDPLPGGPVFGRTPVGYIGIAGHNLGDINGELGIFGTDDLVTYDTLAFATNISSNDPIFLLFGPVEYGAYAVQFTYGDGADTSIPIEIGILKVGPVLEMQRPIYGGHNPITLNRSITKRETVTETGQFIGNVVVRRGLTTTFQWQNLSADWYRENFDPFAEHALTKPFFIAWRPLSFPNEVAFCMATDQPRPQNQGVRDLMSVSMQVRGLVT